MLLRFTRKEKRWSRITVATVLGQASIPRASSSVLSVRGVLRDHFTPVMGSPAVSSASSSSRAATIAVFFYGGTASTRGADAIGMDLGGEQLPAASGHGLDVESSTLGNSRIAASCPASATRSLHTAGAVSR